MPNSKPPSDAAFERLRIVLVRPSHPGNIGAAARALKTMGFARLVLVAPARFPDTQAEAMASGATDVLARAQVVATLPEALVGTTRACALSARRRELARPPQWARDAAQELAEAAACGEEVALVFGNETFGLSNEELAYCNRWAMIPANPAYASLNLAAAVQVLCYEMRMALATLPPVPPAQPAGARASHEEIEALLAYIEQAAVATGFLDPARPGRLMLRLRRLFARADLEKEEINILRGLWAALRQPTGRHHAQADDA